MSRNSFSTKRHIAPLALAVATAVGLVSALLGDGVWDGLSWFCLACPLIGAAYCVKAAR